MNLQNAIDQDVFIIDERTFSDADIQAMDIDDLETLKMQITKKITGISASIKEKQIEYANGGRSAPQKWYMSRRSALSINQRVQTYINYLIKKRRRLSRTISDYFMDEAKKDMPAAEYERLLSRAHEKKNGERPYVS